MAAAVNAASVIAASEETFRSDPSSARAAPAATASLANGRARISAGVFNWDADLPGQLGGENLSPSPTAYLLGALAGCAVAFMADTLAPQLDVRLDGVTATARGSFDFRGLLGIDGVAPDLSQLELEISLISPDPPDRLEALYAAFLERCPIYLALTKPMDVTTRLTVSKHA
jgi:uncharacterized OsmC-like protein